MTLVVVRRSPRGTPPTMRIANKPASESAPGTHRPPERPLFEPPRIRRADEGTRPTSWLEFFFDLVFVVAIDQLARRLQHGVSGQGTLVYLALYGPIWWPGWDSSSTRTAS